MNHQKANRKLRQRRKFRVRKRLQGTGERPRLSVHRTLQNISAQLVDDEKGFTLAFVSTKGSSLSKQVKYGGNIEAATVIGKLIGEKAKDAGIQKVCFDRGSYRYHGRVAALANAAREAGLEF